MARYQNRFILNKLQSFYCFPTESSGLTFNYISIRDFEFIEQPNPQEGIMIKVERRRQTTIIQEKNGIMTLDQFKKKYFASESAEIFNYPKGEQVWFVLGVLDDDKKFHSLSSFKHLNNIDYFKIEIGYVMDDTTEYAFGY